MAPRPALVSEQTQTPGPQARRGPRPLLLHLTLAMLKSSVSAAGSTRWSNGLPRSSAAGGPLAAALGAALAEAAQANPNDPDALPARALEPVLQQDRELIAGIAAYRSHPWRRELSDPPACWQEGGSRLLDYGGSGPAVLFVPSLVNRSYILDLAPGRSMLRFLAENGVSPFLLDWGWPSEVERAFTLTDYIAGRLERALIAVGQKVILAGYCMGGLLTTALAERRPDLVRALVLLATPWDFHAADRARASALADLLASLEPLLRLTGTLPIDALQTLFVLMDPYGVAKKYRAFARQRQDSERASLFVALEDWLNDGVPLAAPVARECLSGWYGANTPARLAWRVAGLPVNPGALALPTFVAAPGNDRIVPPESARPLAAAIAGAHLHEPAAGHVGMVAGRTAETALWRPLLDWVRALSPVSSARRSGKPPSPGR